jgi:hypothetical protein
MIGLKHVPQLGCHNPTLGECEDETYTPKVGTWQFDSRPLKVGNRPDLDVCR